jgi:rhamnogalacturonyl hydrolase YesR
MQFETEEKMNFLDKAKRTGDWIVNNQYVSHPDWDAKPFEDFDMNEDMNYGRFVRNYDLTAKKVTHLSTNWISGMTIYGLLMLRGLTGDDKYLESSLKGSYYLKALQNVMDANPAYRGAFSERITSNRWCAPRDALSAAWGMLRLYQSSGDTEFLVRSEMFADWHMHNAMPDGYPIGYFFFGEKPNKEFLANCQGGSALYYYDLYRTTGKEIYLVPMLKTVDYYVKNFINDDGSINIYFDRKTGKPGDDDSAWADMHKYNDDFSALGILAAYEVTGDKKYLDSVIKYMNWTVSRQNPETGGFGTMELSVSSCVGALNCLNLYLITGDNRFLKSGRKAMAHLDKYVMDCPDDLRIHGGVLGLNVCEVAEGNDVLCLRVSMYALYSFTLYHLYDRYGENDRLGDIPEKLVNNPMFLGLKLNKKK